VVKTSQKAKSGVSRVRRKDWSFRSTGIEGEKRYSKNEGEEERKYREKIRGTSKNDHLPAEGHEDRGWRKTNWLV